MAFFSKSVHTLPEKTFTHDNAIAQQPLNPYHNITAGELLTDAITFNELHLLCHDLKERAFQFSEGK